MITLTPKKKLADILLDINVAKIAYRYFTKSSSWLYHKLNGNGGKGDFTEEELQQLKSALLDLARRIEIVAKTL
jgi:hypothetical protein